jgi:hypothetical protein
VTPKGASGGADEDKMSQFFFETFFLFFLELPPATSSYEVFGKKSV